MSEGQEDMVREDGEEHGEVLANDVVNKSEFLHRSDVLAALLNTRQTNELPAAVKARIHALKNLQLDVVAVETDFFKEIHSLECKYQKLFVPIFEKRAKIVSGEYQPTDEECEPKFKTDTDILCGGLNTVKLESGDEVTIPDSTSEDSTIVGIPNFWLTVLKNNSITSELIEEYDEPILAHLTDIRIFATEDPMGFTLEFHFSPNEFFTNSILVKRYEMKCETCEDDPFSFEGPEIIKTVGCAIDWKKGKNVTIKTVKKKQKHKSKASSVRTVVKTVQNDSFFNFFSPPDLSTQKPDTDAYEEMQTLLTNDFEIGHFMRERLVPKAVLYFTGEALTDEYDEEDGEEEEDDDDDLDDEEDDEEGESDEEVVEKKPVKKKQHVGKTVGENGKESPAECKNQ